MVLDEVEAQAYERVRTGTDARALVRTLSNRELVGGIAEALRRQDPRIAELLAEELEAREVRRPSAKTEVLPTILATAPVGIAWLDAELRYVLVNAYLAGVHGCSTDDLPGRFVRDVVPELWPTLEPILRRVLETGEPTLRVALTGRPRPAPEETYHLEGSYAPLRDETGRVVGVVVAVRDVTQRVRAEDALRASRAAYAHLVDTVDGIVWEADAEPFRFRFVSKAAERLLGYPVATWLVNPGFWADHVHPEDRAVAVRLHEERARALVDHASEYRMIAADGRVVWIRDVVTVTASGGRATELRGVMVDVTERKAAEQEVQRALSLLESAMESTEDGLLVVDLHATVRRYNQRFIEMWNLPPDIAASGDDEPVLAAVVERTLHPEAFLARVRELYAAPEVESRDVIELRDGRIFERYSRPQRLGGEIVGRVWSFRDVTVQRRTEAALQAHRAHLEELVAERTRELVAANRELETFGYSVSHDLRAPLRSLDGFSALLAQEPDLGPRARGYLERIRAATARMARLVDDLLALGRTSRAEMKPTQVDLSAIANQIVAELHESAPDRAVTFAIQEGVTARGDPTLLRVVLENLLRNAWKFTSHHPSAHIAFGALGTPPTYFVRDDGAGFDPAQAGRLFTAFQRLHTEKEFEGTGIGLATVRRIVERHGGRAWAEGVPEGGATIWFTLGPEE